jgi:dienelactone hydrolase
MTTDTQAAIQVRTRPPAQMMGRILGSGVDHVDYARLTRRCEQGGEDWVAVCEELGDQDHRHGEAALAAGHRTTARYFFAAASAVYRIGQYGLTEVTEEKLRLYHKLVDSLRDAAPLFDPPIEEVEIPYAGAMMHGWLYQPKNPPRPSPVVLLIAGATGFKEEGHAYALMLVDRGMAVLAMDGPGQGVTLYFNGLHLETEPEQAHGAMIDWLEHDGRFGAVGIWGMSTGGHYVARTAATDQRIAACVVWGGAWAPVEILGFGGAAYLRKFAIMFGQPDEQVRAETLPKMTMEGLAPRITCPLLVTHGSADPIFTVEGVQRLHDEAASTDKAIRIYPGGWHCAAGYETEVLTLMTDWLADRLVRQGVGPA